MIEQVNEQEFKLKVRGHNMTLRFNNQYKCWQMFTMNASVKAYNNGISFPKDFDSLEAVEAAYKSWKGIAALASTPSDCN